MFPHPLTRWRSAVCARILLIFFSAFPSALISRAQTLNETTLYSFTNTPDGSYPIGGVIAGQDGSLYGTTPYAGTNNFGMLFKLNRNGTGYRDLYAFDISTGGNPTALVQATNGLLYGMAGAGGSNFANGTIFSINTNGAGYHQLHALLPAEGQYPYAALFLASNGVLFGVAPQGGISNAGTVFRINLDGNNFQVLHQFTTSPDGNGPSTVIQGTDGALYGCTVQGGISNAGIVFRLTTNGSSYSILRSFTNSPDGYLPEANLVQGKDGMLYGTTTFGGAYSFGSIFKINTNGSAYAILHNFPSVLGDGSNPNTLMQAADGFLYGAGANSGAFGNGMIFKLDTNGGTYTVVYGFTNSPPDGNNPVSRLLDGGDGALYGTADHGGAFNQGTVFRLTPPLILSAQISTLAGTNTTVFSWPLWAADYTVRTSPNLTNKSWTAITAPMTNGAKLYTTNKSTIPSAFFRLQTGP